MLIRSCKQKVCDLNYKFNIIYIYQRVTRQE